MYGKPPIYHLCQMHSLCRECQLRIEEAEQIPSWAFPKLRKGQAATDYASLRPSGLNPSHP